MQECLPCACHVLARADDNFVKLAHPARFELTTLPSETSAFVTGPIASGPLTTTLETLGRADAWSEVCHNRT